MQLNPFAQLMCLSTDLDTLFTFSSTILNYIVEANLVILIHYILYDSLVFVAALIIGCKYQNQFLTICFHSK